MEQTHKIYSRIDWIILDRHLRYKDDLVLRRVFFIMLGIHLLFFAAIAVATVIKRPMKPPERVYSVQILPMTQREVKVEEPKIVKEPEPEPEPIPEPEPEKPKVIEEKPKPVEKPPDPKEPDPEPVPETPKERVISTGEATVRVEGENFEDDYYIMMVIRKVSRFWQNPLRRTRASVSTVVYFRIHRDGSISDPRIDKRSGNSLFDNSALRAIRSSTPFPELPETYTGDHLGVYFEFEHKP